MLNLAPRAGELEPIEVASRDELCGLQLERLRWTLRHAYEQVALYRSRLDAELVMRGELFRQAGVQDIPSYREGGKTLPRILLQTPVRFPLQVPL